MGSIAGPAEKFKILLSATAAQLTFIDRRDAAGAAERMRKLWHLELDPT